MNILVVDDEKIIFQKLLQNSKQNAAFFRKYDIIQKRFTKSHKRRFVTFSMF